MVVLPPILFETSGVVMALFARKRRNLHCDAHLAADKKKTAISIMMYYVVPNSCAVRNNGVGWKIHPN